MKTILSLVMFILVANALGADYHLFRKPDGQPVPLFQKGKDVVLLDIPVGKAFARSTAPGYGLTDCSFIVGSISEDKIGIHFKQPMHCGTLQSAYYCSCEKGKSIVITCPDTPEYRVPALIVTLISIDSAKGIVRLEIKKVWPTLAETRVVFTPSLPEKPE